MTHAKSAWVSGLIACLVGLIAAMPSLADAEPGQPRVALLPMDQGDEVLSQAEAVLLAAMGQRADVEMVERAKIQKLLSEAQLAALSQADATMDLGQFEAADALIVMEHVKGLPQPTLSLRVVSVLDGIVLDTLLVEQGKLDEQLGMIVQTLVTAAAKAGQPVGSRKYLGWLGVRNEESGTYLLPTVRALSVLVRDDLRRRTDYVLLERSVVDRLMAERNLTGREVRLKTSMQLLEIGLRREGQGDLVASLLFSRPGVAQPQLATTTAQGLTALRANILTEVRRGVDLITRASVETDEAELLTLRIYDLMSKRQDREDLQEILSTAEAALSLMPDDIRYRMAVEAYLNCGSLFSHIYHDDQACFDAFCRRYDIEMQWLTRWESQLATLHPGETAPARPTIEELDYELETFLPKPGDAPGADERYRHVKTLCEERRRLIQVLYTRHHWDYRHVLALRLHHADSIYHTPSDYVSAVRSIGKELDTRPSSRGSSLYGYPELLYASDLEEQFQRMFNERDPSDPLTQADRFIDLFDWLCNHPDTDAPLQLVGWYGRTFLPGDAGIDAARSLLDLFYAPESSLSRFCVTNHTVDIGLDDTAFTTYVQRARLVLREADSDADYFESVLSAAERRQDSEPFARWVWCTRQWLWDRDYPQAEIWANRLLALLQSKEVADPWKYGQHTLIKWIVDERKNWDILAGQRPEGDPWKVIMEEELWPKNLGLDWTTAVHFDRQPSDITGGMPIVIAGVTNQIAIEKTDYHDVVVFRTDLDCTRTREIGRITLKTQEGRGPTSCCAIVGNTLVIGTASDGILLIGQGEGGYYTESEGATAQNIERMVELDGQVYYTFTSGLARFDPVSRSFHQIASSRSLPHEHGLNGGWAYRIWGLVADPKRHQLFMAVESPKENQRGIWRYRPSDNTLIQCVQDSPEGVILAGDHLLYASGDRIVEMDPTSGQVKQLQGYEYKRGASIGCNGGAWFEDKLLLGQSFFTPDGHQYPVSAGWVGGWPCIYPLEKGFLVYWKWGNGCGITRYTLSQ